jgi:hypothetical protein
MPWLKIDEQFYDNPKVVAAGNEAVGMYVRALSYCAHHLTDGHVVAKVWPKLGRSRARVRLEEAGLIVAEEEGYFIPHYLEYNFSAEEVKANKEANSERQRRYRARRKEGNESRVTNNVTDNGRNALPTRLSHYPVPDTPTESKEGTAAVERGAAPASPAPDGARPANRARPIGEGVWYCPYCAGSFATEDELYEHIVHCEPINA